MKYYKSFDHMMNNYYYFYCIPTVLYQGFPHHFSCNIAADASAWCLSGICNTLIKERKKKNSVC